MAQWTQQQLDAHKVLHGEHLTPQNKDAYVERCQNYPGAAISPVSGHVFRKGDR